MFRTPLAPLGLLAAISACGGPPPAPTTPTPSAEAAPPAAASRSRRARSDEGEAQEFPLGREVAVSGTGVRFQPPRGSQRSALGSTFIHPRRRIQIVIAAAEGDLSIHEQFLGGLQGEADEETSEELTLDGAESTLVVDRMTQGEAELERVWLVSRRGTRSVALMAVYAAEQSDTLRGLLRASLQTAHFDERTPLDPESAVGWRLPPVEGLSLVRTASTSLSYSPTGSPPPPNSTAPALFVMPLPFQVPPAQRDAVCPQVLAQLVSLPESVERESGRVDAGEVQGCDLTASLEDPALATYAALVFRGEGAFMIGGTVAAESSSPWIERFRAAARSVEPMTRTPAETEAAEREAAEAGADDDDDVEAEQAPSAFESRRPARAPRRARRPVDEEEEEAQE